MYWHHSVCWYLCVFFFKQKTAYEMRISDWSSDVCSSDLPAQGGKLGTARRLPVGSCRCALAHHRRRPCKAGRRVTSFAERSCPPRPPSREGLRHSHISCRRGPLSPHNGCRPETCSRDPMPEPSEGLAELGRAHVWTPS